MLKRFILWDYPRGSWQYDVIVGIILAFLFLTPRAWYRDQPRVPKGVAVLPADKGSSPFWIDKELLAGAPESQRAAHLTEVMRAQTGDQRLVVTRVEEVRNSEDELLGYMAFATR
ncbi:MAG TPA: hypothetical protein VMU19_02120 [Bryobacteraceae bacterium]|nr:hypothetical protein [Bryobacteraceae bacterium]